MHLAADYGQLEVLEYLAAQGADINAKDKHGISVILAAIWEGHSKCVKFLLDKVSIDTYIGLELPRMPRVPDTRRNSEHHLWHPRILRFLILISTPDCNQITFVTFQAVQLAQASFLQKNQMLQMLF